MLPPEPSYSAFAQPVSVYGIERGWAYGLMLPGILVTCFGLLRVQSGLGWAVVIMATGVLLVPGLILFGRAICGDDPQRMSTYIGALFASRHFVPTPGLRGKDVRT